MATAAPGLDQGALASIRGGLESVRDVAVSILRRFLDSSYLYRALRRLWLERFTARGRFLLLLCAVLAVAGLDTREALVYQLFALAVGPLMVAAVLALRRPPRVRLAGSLPQRLTAGRPVSVGVRVEAQGEGASGPLVLSWTGPDRFGRGVRVSPGDVFLEAHPERPGQARLEIGAERRGRYVVPGLGIGGTDPLGLLATRRASRQPSQAVLAYPRFFRMERLALPVGRRYQPGGIPLASRLGEEDEFTSTREYRRGDPLRKIHWRSWARRGVPVVKEYQEEYFSRIALVLDTYVPRRPNRAQRRSFEAAISLLASIADHFSRTENVVDIFAAGPDIYQVSAGRSLAYLENVLDVLACLEACHEPPFDRVGPHLHEKLSQLTTVVAVVLDWDEQRESFLHSLRELGVAVRTYIVHAGATHRPWAAAAPTLGPITALGPDEVEQKLQAESQL